MPKPCPFCRCKAITIERTTLITLTLKCTLCHVNMIRRTGKGTTLEEAYIDLLARWNRRTQGEQTASEKRIEKSQA